MARLTWEGTHYYESGIDRGVLYAPSQPGVAWIGLVSVNEAPTGGDARTAYIDGIKYLNVSSSEEYKATIEAISAPPEFGPCDGNVAIQNGLIATAQPRKSFGFCYRTLIGNVLQNNVAYKLHLIYNALAAPTTRNNNTLRDSAGTNNYSWEITTKAPPLANYKPTAHLMVDSRYVDPTVLVALEDLLYGTVSTSASLPNPDDVVALFA